MVTGSTLLPLAGNWRKHRGQDHRSSGGRGQELGSTMVGAVQLEGYVSDEPRKGGENDAIVVKKGRIFFKPDGIQGLNVYQSFSFVFRCACILHENYTKSMY